MKQTAIPPTASGLLQAGARISLALLILLLPKCGLCLALYLNIFSIMGISLTKVFPFILPVLCVLLSLNLLIGFVKARRANDYFAWILSVIASLILLINKLWVEHALLAWVAAGLLVSATAMQLFTSRKTCSRNLLR